MSDTPIYVTKPALPPLEEFIPYLKQIWESGVLTNGGEMHKALEEALCDYLGVPHISLFANGTIALVTALQALRVTGEVITTPFSFVATTHSLQWNGNRPVFVDIDPVSFNLDPARIEAAITRDTTALMPVHCYGTPCNVDEIQRIADSYNLRVIYDAAHAFAVRDRGGSVLNHGDLSVLSFHATKVFNTFEGGAIVSPDARTKQRIDRLKNFGFVDETRVVATGINGKMSEVNAAFGLLQLKYVDAAIERRKRLSERYLEFLRAVPGLTLPVAAKGRVENHSYYPVLVEDCFPVSRDVLFQRLKAKDIHPRRYFYPLISEFPMYRGLPSAATKNLPVASRVAAGIICLPIYPDMTDGEQDRIIDGILAVANG